MKELPGRTTRKIDHIDVYDGSGASTFQVGERGCTKITGPHLLKAHGTKWFRVEMKDGSLNMVNADWVVVVNYSTKRRRKT